MLLIIDDEPKLLELMSRYLSRVGFEVETCGDASEALARFQAEPDRFSMAITDLSLGALNGEELIERMRQLRPGLPAIITSGYPYAPRGADIGFVQKPFLPQVLADAVEKAQKDAAG